MAVSPNTPRTPVAADAVASDVGERVSSSPHGRATRLVHAAFALAVVTQLASSQLMVAPLDGHAANWLFEVHEYAGLAALVIAFGFWVTVARRRRGTPVARLVPWFSAAGRHAVLADAREHWNALRARRLPAYEEQAPLASAVHGLGLLLVSAMAATGALFAVALWTGASEASWAGLDLQVHTTLANLVWAYLIGHAGTALVYARVRQLRLADMWALGDDGAPDRRTV